MGIVTSKIRAFVSTYALSDKMPIDIVFSFMDCNFGFCGVLRESLEMERRLHTMCGDEEANEVIGPRVIENSLIELGRAFGLLLTEGNRSFHRGVGKRIYFVKTWCS